MALKYEQLSSKATDLILNHRSKLSPYATPDEDYLRRNMNRDKQNAVRTSYIRDIDKIMHCTYFNRYSDKTQVFSFYKNDDVSRRMLHVQLVSRIARTIGKALGLNVDLIEAIALGHDIGHTPFGHTGEKVLDGISFLKTGRHFYHNIHSVRVLDSLCPMNLTLQTLDGISCHNGELELREYHPGPKIDFKTFDEKIELCYYEPSHIKKMVPSTLEGCVVRVSDIIAYLGKDRQDAQKAKIISENSFDDNIIGTQNAEIINNLVINIIENSIGKDYIKLDDKHFESFKKAKSDNYSMIYGDGDVSKKTIEAVQPMMTQLYDQLYDDLIHNNAASPILTQHIPLIESFHYKRDIPYTKTDPNQIVIDFIAGMTDDYFVDIFNYIFPGNSHTIHYKGYFE